MATTEPRTMRLDDFLTTYSVCHVWYCSQGTPAGSDTFLDLDPEHDEDYCDEDGLLQMIPPGLHVLEGTVTVGADGAFRWQVDSLADDDYLDAFGSTLFNLVVWGRGAPMS